jgi:histidinol phosphatase-like PHP family hydrolase
MEEYVLAAVKKGVKEFGFSDHAPLPQHLREGISMLPEEAELYIKEVLAVKEKFSSSIDVNWGLKWTSRVLKHLSIHTFLIPGLIYL